MILSHSQWQLKSYHAYQTYTFIKNLYFSSSFLIISFQNNLPKLLRLQRLGRLNFFLFKCECMNCFILAEGGCKLYFEQLCFNDLQYASVGNVYNSKTLDSGAFWNDIVYHTDSDGNASGYTFGIYTGYTFEMLPMNVFLSAKNSNDENYVCVRLASLMYSQDDFYIESKIFYRDLGTISKLLLISFDPRTSSKRFLKVFSIL